MTTTHGTAELRLTSVPTWHVFSFFKRCCSMLQGWHKRVRLRTALYGLQDRELKDIGVMRGEIEYLVSNGSDAIDRDGRYRGGAERIESSRSGGLARPNSPCSLRKGAL